MQPKSNEEEDQSSNSQIENVIVNEKSETNQSSDLGNEVLDLFSLREYEEGEAEDDDDQVTYDINITKQTENNEIDQTIDNEIDFLQNDLNCLLESPKSQNDSDEVKDNLKRKNSSLSENSIDEEENITKAKSKSKKMHKSKHETLVAL